MPTLNPSHVNPNGFRATPEVIRRKRGTEIPGNGKALPLQRKETGPKKRNLFRLPRKRASQMLTSDPRVAATLTNVVL
jgi:hypothetical protein